MSKQSPWLRVPATEYDGHMGHESVGQTDALNRIFADLIKQYPPKKGICVLGCATGNGFEHIPDDKMVRVVGVDINLNYLHLVRERHGDRLRWLELQCRDVLRCEFPDQAFDHVHAALLFEYTDPAAALKRIRPWLTDDGVLTVVLQHRQQVVQDADDPHLRASGGRHLPADPESDDGRVSESPFEGVKILHDVINLVLPADFITMTEEVGLGLLSSERVSLPQGKAFEVMVFER